MNEQHDHTTDASESSQPTWPVGRGLLMTVTLWVPLGILLAGLIVLLAWLPRLPAEVAIHWGPDGNADGFAAPWVLIAAYLATSGLFIAISAWSTLAGVRSLARFDGPADAPRSGLPRTVRLSAVIGPSGVLFVTVHVPRFDRPATGRTRRRRPGRLAGDHPVVRRRRRAHRRRPRLVRVARGRALCTGTVARAGDRTCAGRGRRVDLDGHVAVAGLRAPRRGHARRVHPVHHHPADVALHRDPGRRPRAARDDALRPRDG